MYDNTILSKADADNEFLNSNMRKIILNNNNSIRIYDNANKGKPTLLFIPMIKEINLIYVPLIKFFQDVFRTIIYEPNLSTVKHCGIADRANEIVNILDTLQIEKIILENNEFCEIRNV